MKPVRDAAANCPRRTKDPRKKNLLLGRQQAMALARLLNEYGVDHCSVAEAHSAFRETVREDLPRWATTPARSNDVFPRTRIGNDLLTNVSGKGWVRQGRHSLPQRFRDQKRGKDRTVYMASSLSMRKADDVQVTNLAVHLPSSRSIGDVAWRRMAYSVLEYAADIPGTVSIAGDWNAKREEVRRAAAEFEMRVGAFREVMGVVLKEATDIKEIVYGGPKYHGRISDHSDLVICEYKPLRRTHGLTKHDLK